jgi:hypothetical protein
VTQSTQQNAESETVRASVEQPPIVEIASPGQQNGRDRDPLGKFAPGTTVGEATRFQLDNTKSLRKGNRSARVARGAMPEQAEALAALAEHRQYVENDLGGAAQLSRLQRDLVSRYLECVLVANYLGDNLQRLGPLTGKGRTRAAMTAYLQALDRQVRIAQLLGLARVARPGQTLEGYLAASKTASAAECSVSAGSEEK